MIFVTGGSGLVGSHLLNQLTKQNKSVCALKREGSNTELVRQLFAHYGNSHFDAIDWVDGDITEPASLTDALAGCTEVYHCAALVSFDPRDANVLYKLNVEGTANVVNACLEAGVKRLCHVSSTAATGAPTNNEPVTEKYKWENKNGSYYSVSKHRAEQEVYRGIEEGLNAFIVNPCVIIGPGDWNKSSLIMFKQMEKGVSHYGMGSNAIVDARDVANAMIKLMETNVVGERYLLIGENLPFKKTMNTIADALGKKRPAKPAKPWKLAIAWRMLKFITWFTGKPPLVSKQSAASSLQNISYSNEKVKQTIEIDFHPLNQAVQNVIDFRKYQQQ